MAKAGWDEGHEPLCIHFANSVGSRGSEHPREYLASPEDLRAWLDKRDFGPVGPLSEAFLARTLRLRDALYEALATVASGGEPAPRNLEAINAELRVALGSVSLERSEWVLRSGNRAEEVLMLAALSAAELLTSERRSRVRTCADRECAWLFLDSSKNRSRRWCSMAECGNLAKARRFQAKQRMTPSQ